MSVSNGRTDPLLGRSYLISRSAITLKLLSMLFIDHELAFNYWANAVLKKRDRIISLVRQRQTTYQKKTHKYGLEVHKTVAEAFAIDKKNGNTMWQDAIAKEMKNAKVAFDVKDEEFKIPPGYQVVKCHMIFDIKIEDFRQNVASKCMTYSYVVGRETLRIALTIAALNSLEVQAGDVMNAYVTVPVTDKIYTILGPEWGKELCGKKALVVRALYGLKSSGAVFRACLADCISGTWVTSHAWLTLTLISG